MSWPTIDDVIAYAGGRDLEPALAAAALQAAIAEAESRTGWRPLWKPSDERWSQVIRAAWGPWVELQEPMQVVERVRFVGGEENLAFEPLGTGRVEAIKLGMIAGGADLEVSGFGGAFGEVPADLRAAVAMQAARLATVDLATSDAAKIAAGGLSIEVKDVSWLDHVCARYRRVRL
jgi:hypothetical protein